MFIRSILFDCCDIIFIILWYIIFTKEYCVQPKRFIILCD